MATRPDLSSYRPTTVSSYSPTTTLIEKIEEQIKKGKLPEAIKNVLFACDILENKEQSYKERVYDLLIYLLPNFTLEHLKDIKPPLQRLFDQTHDFPLKQRELAQRLAEIHIKHKNFLEAMHYYAKAIRISDDHNFSNQDLHRAASQLFIQMIRNFFYSQFKDKLDLARRRFNPENESHPKQFEDLLKAIDALQPFCCEVEDKTLIYDFYAIVRDVHQNIPNQSKHHFPFLKTIEQGLLVNFSLCDELPTQKYKEGLLAFRSAFTFSRKDIRKFQEHTTVAFKDFFRLLIEDALAVLGPPPCGYDIRAMGSIAREEPCPFSDLEMMILIEKEEERPYFTALVQILEMQIASLNESQDLDLVFTCLLRPLCAGFHLDSGGNPALVSDLINTPNAMAALQREEVEPNKPCHTVLKSSPLYSNANLMPSYQIALNQILDENNRKVRATKLLRGRLADYHDIWGRRLNLPGSIEIKKEFIQLLNYALSDIGLYFNITNLNTLDIICWLEEKGIITSQSKILLRKAVEMLYSMRIDYHQIYKEQKDNISLRRALESGKEALEKIYFLVLRPFWICLERALKKETIFENEFKNVDLIELILDEICSSDHPLTLKPAIVYLAKHLRENYEKHIEVFKTLSKHEKTEPLRKAYFETVSIGEKNHLAFIPNLITGFRYAFQREALELKQALESMTTIESEKSRHKTVGKVKVIGSFRPQGLYLSPAIIDKILDEKGDIKKSYEESNHQVAEAGGIHFKQKPYQALMEYANHSLLFRLAGHFTPATQLVRFEFEGNKKSYPVLLSLTIPGKTRTLKEISECDVDEKNWEQDGKAWERWTWMILCSLLTCPGDGRLSNYLLDEDNNIFCVDNDISFVIPVMKDGWSKKVDFCSALFLLLPEKPLNKKALLEFAHLQNIDTILNAWIEDVIEKEKEYLSLFPDEKERKRLYEEDPKRQFKAKTCFRQGALATLNSQAYQLQNFLLKNIDRLDHLCSQELLKQLIFTGENLADDKDIGIYVYAAYERVSTQKSLIKERLKREKGKDPSFQDIIEGELGQITERRDGSLTSPQADTVCLKLKKPATFEEAEKLLDKLGPSEAKGELFHSILRLCNNSISMRLVGDQIMIGANFKGVNQQAGANEDRQKVILKLLTYFATHEDPRTVLSDKKKPKVVILQHCVVLDSKTLDPFLHEGLTYLDLSFCPKITDKDIKTISQKCSQLKYLCLSGCSGLESVIDGVLFTNPLRFSHLEQFHIEQCAKLQRLEFEAPVLKELKANDNSQLRVIELNPFIPPVVELDRSPNAITHFQRMKAQRMHCVATWKVNSINTRIKVLAFLERDKLAIGFTDKTFKLMDLKTGKCLKILSDEDDSFRAPRSSCMRSNKYYYYSKDYYQFSNGKYHSDIYEGRAGGKIVQLRLYSNIAITGSDETIIKLWDVKAGKCVKNLKGHSSEISEFAVDGDTLVSGDSDGTIKFWRPTEY